MCVHNVCVRVCVCVCVCVCACVCKAVCANGNQGRTQDFEMVGSFCGQCKVTCVL